jgi:hypothetical protein
MRIGTFLERLVLCLCFGLWLLLVSGWAVAEEVWLRDAQAPFDLSYRLGDADLSGYQKVLLDPLSVWYAEQSAPELLAGNVIALQRRFARVFGETLAANGFLLVDEPGDSVLRLHVELVDMRVNRHTPEQIAWGQRFKFPVTPGHMTLVAEVRSGATGEVVLRIADQDDGGEKGDRWALVDEIFESWAQGIAATLHTPAKTNLVAQGR